MYILYFLSIFLCIFQDLPLANYIGDYGRSISGIVACAILFWTLLRNKKIVLNKTIKVLLYLLMYIMIYNSVILIGYIFSGKTMIFLGEDIFNKSLKISMYYFSNLVYLLSLYQIGRCLSEKDMLKPFYYIYFFLFIFSILEYIQLPKAFPFLHATRSMAYNRIRLLTNESSNSSTIILVFFTLGLQYAKKYKERSNCVLMIVSLLFFIYTSTAKSLFVVLAISIVILILFNGKVKLKYKFLISLAFIIAVVFLSKGVMKYFNLAMTSSTTLYTRGYTYVISFLLSLKYPFGVSNVLYLEVFTSELKRYLTLAQSFVSNFNAKEIMYILTSGTDKNISAYSGILQYGIYWGIIGNIIFIVNIIKGVKNGIKNRPILFFGSITILFSILTTISLDNKYEIWAFLFVLLMYNERGNEIEWKK